MPYIIGTAGHIDHGKTTLIKALTGQDTDRLKEEKERGISIDLGFAYLDLPDGSRAGVVDVPGHERFIRNMLAGAHGIDLVLFTVAADDGIMPQTEEHLDIVHLLGVKLAIFLITKIDLVPPQRIREVEEDIRILALGTAFEDSPIIPFSAVTGQGLPELRERIFELLQRCERPAAGGYFRLPVDRVFVLQGHGLIVTGTAQSGEIAVGDRVRALPGDDLFRVRNLQVHNRSVPRASWGQRVALNLAGPDKAPLERGHVICHEKLTRVTDRFDALLEVRPAAAKGIRNHQRIRVHLGTAERLGKVVLLGDRERAGPKQSVYAQIVLSEPLLALRGDRFIVRDETAQRTLGGGSVVHPWAPPHRRKEERLAETLDALRSPETPRALRAFIEADREFATPLGTIAQFLNLGEEEAQRWLGQVPGLMTLSGEQEKLYTTEAKWRGLTDEIVRTLADFHAAHPLAPGMDMEELRGKLGGNLGPRLFRERLELLAAEGRVVRDGNLVRLPTHRVKLGQEERALSEKVARLLRESALQPPDLKQIEKELGVPPNRLLEVIRVMEREKRVVRVTSDLYFAADAVDRIKALLYKYLAAHGEITAAAFRDLLGSSRKYAIGLLEYFDREGITARIGDVRRLRSPSPAKTG